VMLEGGIVGRVKEILWLKGAFFEWQDKLKKGLSL
jgi:hypothetical protein